MPSTNDPLGNIMKTQGRDFFSVRAYGYHADDRISNPKKISLENLEVNQHKVANLRSIVRAYSVRN